MDSRLSTLIIENGEHHFSLISFPKDDGCIANGGRGGAKNGPLHVLNLLPKTGPVKNAELGIDISSIRIKDWGEALSHQSLIQKVREASKQSIPIIIGGSNDQSFPNAKGLLQNYPSLDVVNIDAHLDVRPGIGHSGSPFQELLNSDNFIGQFDEFACQGNQCSAIHVDWALQQGAKIHWLKDIDENSFQTLLDSRDKPLFVSFDIDAIKSSDCPGVSCPSTRGLSSEDALDICFRAGKCSRVVGLDISEFNPSIENNITPRLICQMIYYFIMGYRSRNA